jgi:hypothetical protein
LSDESEDDGQQGRDATYTEASATGFDHPNVNIMDGMYLLTMNNEKIENGYISSNKIEAVKAEVAVMGATERMFAGGFYDVETARAIEAGAFTLERGIEGARDGFTARLKHSSFNYDLMMPAKKSPGFLGRLFGRGNQEPTMYQAERR